MHAYIYIYVFSSNADLVVMQIQNRFSSNAKFSVIEINGYTAKINYRQNNGSLAKDGA